MKKIFNWKTWLIFSLTLGLAPFTPEPHILGKLRWISGGAQGMQPIDWFDFLMHGSPWLLLFTSLGVELGTRLYNKKTSNQL